MSLYAIAVFLHIVGALGLFAALALEWASILSLRRATVADHAREWARLLASLRLVGGPAVLTILVTGIYMMATRWGGQGWIGVGFGGLVLVAVLGGTLTGRRAGPLLRAASSEDGPVSAALGDRLSDPALMFSLYLRTALALGIVFVMSVKPGTAGALTAMGVALVLGLATGFPSWSRGRRAAEAQMTRLDGKVAEERS
jgi:hypothetical protein